VENNGSFNGVLIKIENFEGPLDLLYHLIGKNKMSIYDIKINEIADQYMEYLAQMEALDLEIASEFLVIAATLLSIKSRLLLPSKKDKELEEEEIDPKEELLLKVLEYKKYKEFSGTLKEREAYWGCSFYKEPEGLEFDFGQEDLNIKPHELKEVYVGLLKRNAQKRNHKAEVDMVKIIQYEKVSLQSKIREVLRALLHKPWVKFTEIFMGKGKSKLEIITGFLAILELSKSKKVQLFQEDNFSDIEIHPIEEFHEMGTDTMDEEKNIG
jgi:segregation and condensation protein A